MSKQESISKKAVGSHIHQRTYDETDTAHSEAMWVSKEKVRNGMGGDAMRKVRAREIDV